MEVVALVVSILFLL